MSASQMRVLWRGTVGESLPSCCGVPYPGDVVYYLSSSKTTAEDTAGARQGHHSTPLHRRSGGACFRGSTSDGLPARQRQATHGTGHPGIPGTAQHHHNGLASFKSRSEPHRALVGRDSAHDQPTPCSCGDRAAAPPGRRGHLQQHAQGLHQEPLPLHG